MKADQTTEKEVKEVLDEMIQAYESRDIHQVMNCFFNDSDLVMYGTGKDEKRIGVDQVKAQVNRDWEQSESTRLSYDWVSVSASGNVAWIAADVKFKVKAGGETFLLDGRLTCVLEKRNDKWGIVQAHFSLPSMSQQEGESF